MKNFIILIALATNTIFGAPPESSFFSQSGDDHFRMPVLERNDSILRQGLYLDTRYFANTGFRANTDAVSLRTDIFAVDFFAMRMAISGNMAVLRDNDTTLEKQFLLRRYITDGTNLKAELYIPVFIGRESDAISTTKAKIGYAIGLNLAGGSDISSLNSTTAINSENSIATFSAVVNGSLGTDSGRFSLSVVPTWFVCSRNLLKELDINNENEGILGNYNFVVYFSGEARYNKKFALIADVGASGFDKIRDQLKARLSIAYSS